MSKVKLVAYTNPNIDGINSLEDFIAFCARVSNPSNQLNTASSHKLIQYCMNNKHWSIFEMVNIVLEITTTRDIARQILRHRSFAFQEFSQRYANPVQDLNFETREARLQDYKNRQKSLEVDDADLKLRWEDQQDFIIKAARSAYDWAIVNGIAKEQERAVLPEGLIESRLYMNGSLRSWIHYIELRSANGTQKEHQEIAKECAKVIAKIFPLMQKFNEENL